MGRIEDIWQRAEKATKGPWEHVIGTVRVEAKEQWVANAQYDPDSQGTPVTFQKTHDRYEAESNAEFIAHSREDIPWLLSEVKRLEEALKYYAKHDSRNCKCDLDGNASYHEIAEEALSHAQAQGEGKGGSELA